MTLDEIILKHAMSMKQNANALGEILREWAFTPNGLGCYTNFELQPEFVRVTPGPREFKKIMNRDFDPYGRVQCWFDNDDDILRNLRWFKHPNGIEVGWYWDGDGTLCFYVPELENDEYNGSLWNDDCKKTYGWEFGER